MKGRIILKILRWLLYGMAGLAVLIALFIAEENWRGKRAWEECKRDLEAQGEHLDLAYFIPPPVPDGQNFAMTPLFKPLFDYTVDLKAGEITYRDPHPPVKEISVDIPDPSSSLGYKRIPISDLGKYIAENVRKPLSPIQAAMPIQKGGWQTGMTRDLQEWQTYYRVALPGMVHPQSPAEDVLAVLGRFDAIYSELREAAKTRPLCVVPRAFDVDPEAMGTTAFYSELQDLERVVALRAIAELRLNRSDAAFEDLEFGFRVIDSIKDQPLLICNLVRISFVAILMQPLWEGIAAHRWTDGQLNAIQGALQSIDFLSDCKRCMRAEMAWSGARNDYVRSSLRDNLRTADMSVRTLLSLAAFYPGFFYQNEVAEWRAVHGEILPLVDEKSQRVDAAGCMSEEKPVGGIREFNFYAAFARMATPGYLSVIRKDAQTQTWVNEALVACSIERYRLAHGTLPATLDDLHMTGLPHDIISGQPLHYRVTGDDYILYSVGWNGVDGGGKIVKYASGSIDRTQGDWVWSLKPL